MGMLEIERGRALRWYATSRSHTGLPRRRPPRRPAAPPPRRPAAEHALSPASCPRLARWDSAPRNVQGWAYALCES